MNCPPIIERELRVAARKLDVRKMRWNISLICCSISVAILLIAVIGGESFIRAAYPWLFVAAIYFTIDRTYSLTAGMFVEERQDQTLGFLFLAGLTMPEIFITKILGAFLIAITHTLAFIPFLAIPFLAGGISLDVFWATVWCLPNLVVLALALNTFASVCCKEESAATNLSRIIAAVLCLFTPALHWLGATSAVKMSDLWLLLSPAYGPWLVTKNFSYASAESFWWNTLVTLGWSALFFTAAAIVLRNTWRSDITGSKATFLQKFIPSWLTRSEQWKQQRATLLDRNPFAWLSSHDRHSERLAWAIIIGTALIWLLGWIVIGNAWITVPNFFITAAIVNLELTGVVLYAAAKRIGEDRRTGALELLLVTPITPLEIVQGQVEALRAQFRTVSFVTGTTCVGLAVLGFGLRDWNWRSLLVYVMAWTLLIFLAFRLPRRNTLATFYAALISGRPSFAVWKTANFTSFTSWIWFFLNGKSIFSNLYGFPTGNWLELLIFAAIMPITVFATIVYRQDDPSMHPYSEKNLKESHLVQDFRRIAQTSIPDKNDKRFKKWHPTQRFPMQQPLI